MLEDLRIVLLSISSLNSSILFAYFLSSLFNDNTVIWWLYYSQPFHLYGDCSCFVCSYLWPARKHTTHLPCSWTVIITSCDWGCSPGDWKQGHPMSSTWEAVHAASWTIVCADKNDLCCSYRKSTQCLLHFWIAVKPGGIYKRTSVVMEKYPFNTVPK